MLKLSVIQFVVLFASTTLTFAQNANQAAVDTLTKDVATAVFANIASINQPKAREIYDRLLTCGDGCDPQQIIRDVGSWDQVGAKMQELSELKNTQRFQAMSPGEANTAIRRQLAQFYATHKAEKPYSIPLSPSVQQQILAKIDALLPPSEVAEPTPSASPTATEPLSNEETDSPAAAAQSSPPVSQNKQDQQFWMILISLLGGLLGGAAAVYFLFYRETKAEANRLRDENARLSQSLDMAQRNRTKPTNEPRQVQNADRQKAQAYDALLAELGTSGDPVAFIRQLKQAKSGPVSEPTPAVRPNEPLVASIAPPESTAVPSQPQPISVQQTATPVQSPTRSDVFYFPPPDPNGQFDLAQKSPSLSPESAYRFSTSADNPALATFRFEAEPGRIARFLTYRNYMIEPACDSENSYSTTYTQIVMRRDGEATLENGTWRVKAKALIRYQ